MAPVRFAPHRGRRKAEVGARMEAPVPPYGLDASGKGSPSVASHLAGGGAQAVRPRAGQEGAAGAVMALNCRMAYDSPRLHNAVAQLGAIVLDFLAIFVAIFLPLWLALLVLGRSRLQRAGLADGYARAGEVLARLLRQLAWAVLAVGLVFLNTAIDSATDSGRSRRAFTVAFGAGGIFLVLTVLAAIAELGGRPAHRREQEPANLTE